MDRKSQSRRDFLKTLSYGAVALSLPACNAPAVPPRKTNIVYLLADDLGYGDLSCYGQEKFRTPNIDRLAAEGLRFTQHYSGSTVCAPSRASLMTGLHTGHTPVRGNREIKPEGQTPLPPDTVTLAKCLKNAGYATGAFGKWGLGFPGSTGDPVKQGFDEFFGYNCQREAHNYYPDHLWHNDTRVPLDGKTYSHDLIVDKAFDFIRRHRNKPFFCFMPITIPHAALQIPEKHVAPFRERFPEFEDVTGRYAGTTITNPPACFAAMVTHLDEQVGQLVTLLSDLGIAKDTLVIFTSDNGPHQEGGHDPEFFRSSGPFRGIKRDLYEGGIRAPMIARWPGRTPHRDCEHISAFWDVLPTFCEIAGAPIPAGLDGISFLPTLLGKPDQQKHHDYLYWEFHELSGAQAIRQGRWKAVRPKLNGSPNAPIELYDLETDPVEQNDLAADKPDMIQHFKKLFVAARTVDPDWPLFKK